MENGLMNSHMMGFTDVRGLNILEDAIAKHPNETYKNIDIQKSLDQYGFKHHKGYGTKEHYEAIEKYGITPIHRKSFLKNVL